MNETHYQRLDREEAEKANRRRSSERAKYLKYDIRKQAEAKWQARAICNAIKPARWIIGPSTGELLPY